MKKVIKAILYVLYLIEDLVAGIIFVPAGLVNMFIIKSDIVRHIIDIRAYHKAKIGYWLLKDFYGHYLIIDRTVRRYEYLADVCYWDICEYKKNKQFNLI